MQAVGIILILISIGTVVGPIAGVVVMYRDNLAGLVITPQINDLMNGGSGSGIMANDQAINNNNQDNYFGGNIVLPSFVSSSVNQADRTFQVIFNVTNPLNYDLTVNSISSTVQCSQDHYVLGSISLANPVVIPSGQSSMLTISGYWTQNAENHIQTSHTGQTSINVELINTSVDVNGITVQELNAVSIPSGIPIS
jgi:hypothetical protein